MIEESYILWAIYAHDNGFAGLRLSGIFTVFKVKIGK